MEISANQDQNQVEMSVNEHLPSNQRDNASSTSGNVPPCGTTQSAGSRDHQASNLTETPPGKITWRSLEQMHQTHRNSSIPVSAPNEFPPDPGKKLNWKTSIAEETDENESDDQSYSSDEGIIDGTRPPPNKDDIVKELWRPRSRKQRKKKTTKQRMNQGGQILT